MMGLAVGDDRLVGRHGLRGVHGAQLAHRLEGAVGAKVLSPLDIDRAGNVAAAPGAHVLAGVLVGRPRVEQGDARIVQSIPHPFGARHALPHARRTVVGARDGGH